jgi:hypothetical protein
MMHRRSFLSLLGLTPVAAVVPKKSFFFFGGIFRPRGQFVVNGVEYQTMQEALDNIPRGGTVYLREGTYVFGKSFFAPEHFGLFSIEGHPKSAVIGCVFNCNATERANA